MIHVPERIGIIGGSGIYDIAGLTNKRWEKVTSPFGEPSSELLFGELDGHNIVFSSRGQVLTSRIRPNVVSRLAYWFRVGLRKLSANLPAEKCLTLKTVSTLAQATLAEFK